MKLNYSILLLCFLFITNQGFSQKAEIIESENIELSTYYAYIQGTIDEANKKLIKQEWKITSAILNLSGTTTNIKGSGIKFLIFDFSKSNKDVKSTNVVLTISAPIVSVSSLEDSDEIKDKVSQIVNYLFNNCTSVESQYKGLDSYPKSIELTVLHGVEKKGKGKLGFKLFDEMVSVSGELGKDNAYVQKITFKAERVIPSIFAKE